MRDASRLAARQPRRGGLPNALFVLAAAEALPVELDGRVDELRIMLPWGSLLRGAICAEPWLVDGMHRLLGPAAESLMLLSVTERDAAMGLPVLDLQSLDALAGIYGTLGFTLLEARAATAEDVRDSGSGWARRLDIPRRRPAWWLRLRAPGPPAGTAGGGGDVRGPSPSPTHPGRHVLTNTPMKGERPPPPPFSDLLEPPARPIPGRRFFLVRVAIRRRPRAQRRTPRPAPAAGSSR